MPWQPSSSPRPVSKAPEATAQPTTGLLPTPPAKSRFRHLSGPELDERRDKGLCFNCDRNGPNKDKCGARVFLIEVQAAQLSLLLFLELHWDTIRILGFIGSQPVRVLVDSGSTHNFIQESLVDDLGPAHDSIKPFKVLVGVAKSCFALKYVQRCPLCCKSILSPLIRIVWTSGCGYCESHTPIVGLHYFQKATRFDTTAQFFSLSIVGPIPDFNTNPNTPVLTQTPHTRNRHPPFSVPNTTTSSPNPPLYPRPVPTNHTTPPLANSSRKCPSLRISPLTKT
ncbi:hypothetical protein ACSQ67_007456 [Phaseolus vulgaris]